MNSKICIIVFICISFLTCTTTYAWEKVGYINLQRLVNESSMGKTAKANIEKMRQRKQTEIDSQLKDIQDLKTRIEKNGALMGEERKTAEVEKLQRKLKTYKRMVADAKEELANEDSKLVSTILEKADSVLKQVARKEKYTIILKDPDAIGYLDPKVDITDLVIQAFNKQVK